jgi:hypothetical protein
MGDKPKIISGSKIDPADDKTRDRAKMGILMVGPPHPEDVEGQSIDVAYCKCPWCGMIGRYRIEADPDQWLRCGSCGMPLDGRPHA